MGVKLLTFQLGYGKVMIRSAPKNLKFPPIPLDHGQGVGKLSLQDFHSGKDCYSRSNHNNNNKIEN